LRLDSASGCCRLAPRPRCLPYSSFRAFEIPTYAIVLRIMLFASLFPPHVASMSHFLPRVRLCASVFFYASNISCILCSILSGAKPKASHNTFPQIYCTNSVCFCLASGVPGWVWAYISSTVVAHMLSWAREQGHGSKTRKAQSIIISPTITFGVQIDSADDRKKNELVLSDFTFNAV
jgi:hypothetical protein